VEQFGLRVGDLVNPMMRPAGVLIPEGAGRRTLTAGFGQIEAQVMKVGMVAEATCISKPWTVIPMVVTQVQDLIAAGQFRGGEQLIDAQHVTRPGTIAVFLEPLYEGGLDGVTPGSSCIANAYSSNHDVLASGKRWHDAVGGSSRCRCGRHRPRHDLAYSGAGAADQDPGVQWTLT
jgi:multidrug resistance efflux pump